METSRVVANQARLVLAILDALDESKREVTSGESNPPVSACRIAEWRLRSIVSVTGHAA